MPELTPAQRTLRARIGAFSMHARNDSRAVTQSGRTAFLERFLAEVDPEGVLPPAERERRAEAARKAYFTRLQLASSKARSKSAKVVAFQPPVAETLERAA